MQGVYSSMLTSTSGSSGVRQLQGADCASRTHMACRQMQTLVEHAPADTGDTVQQSYAPSPSSPASQALMLQKGSRLARATAAEEVSHRLSPGTARWRDQVSSSSGDRSRGGLLGWSSLCTLMGRRQYTQVVYDQIQTDSGQSAALSRHMW